MKHIFVMIIYIHFYELICNNHYSNDNINNLSQNKNKFIAINQYITKIVSIISNYLNIIVLCIIINVILS